MSREAGAAGPGAHEDAVRATLRLVRRYVIQETVTPLRHLLSRALLGTAAAVVTGVGAVVLLLALLRVLQTETGSALAGSWSFAPYLLTAVVAAGLVGAAGLVALRTAGRRARRR